MVDNLLLDPQFQAGSDRDTSDISVLCVPLLLHMKLVGESDDHSPDSSPLPYEVRPRRSSSRTSFSFSKNSSSNDLDMGRRRSRRRSTFGSPAHARSDDETPTVVGVLKCVNKMDENGRVGVSFSPHDVGVAEIFASLLMEEP
ncbi:hypothetical protein OAO87_00745 [bacterium]|nr:hypothetical protein [bacterium]